MSDRDRRLSAFVERLLRDRRPRRFGAADDEATMMLTAAALRAGRPGADAPRTEFVEKLEQRLQREMALGDESSPTPRVTRRRLLSSAAAVAAAAAVGAGVDRFVDRSAEKGGAPAAALVPEQAGRWIDVAAVDAVPVGRPLRFSAGAVEGFLVNHGDRMQAVSAVCSHMPCTLNLNVAAQRLDCPCHGAWFALDGTPISSSGYADHLPPLAEVRMRVTDGRVEVFGA